MIWRLITLEDYASSSRLGVMFWASKRHCGLPMNEVCEGLGVYLEDLPEWLGEVYVTLAQGEYGEDWVSWAACSVTGCPGLRVLEFKYSAAPTRRTTETTVGTGLPNHCLHQPTGSISSTLSFPHYCVECFVHICAWRLWLKIFSISLVQFLQYVCLHHVLTLSVLCACLHFIMMTMLVFCYVPFWVLIPLQVVLHLGISSPAHSSVKNS